MSRFIHLVNMWQRYQESKGSPESMVEEPPLTPRRGTCHFDLEESASHHLGLQTGGTPSDPPKGHLSLELAALPPVEGGGCEALSS